MVGPGECCNVGYGTVGNIQRDNRSTRFGRVCVKRLVYDLPTDCGQLIESLLQ